MANSPFIIKPYIMKRDVIAVIACINGKATPEQAQVAIDWVMREAARVPDLSFQLGGEDGRRASDFADGRRYVGLLIREMLDPETMRRAEDGPTPKG